MDASNKVLSFDIGQTSMKIALLNEKYQLLSHAQRKITLEKVQKSIISTAQKIDVHFVAIVPGPRRPQIGPSSYMSPAAAILPRAIRAQE